MEQDLAVLQNISDTLKTQSKASQRQLAKNANMSLGMMNAILGRFVERGWIMLTNVNGRKLAYALTAQGISELTTRGKNFALRTFKIANDYSQVLYNTFLQAHNSGTTKVILWGQSYIKFIIEYECTRAGMAFECLNASNYQNTPEALNLAGDQEEEAVQQKLIEAGCVGVVEMVMGK